MRTSKALKYVILTFACLLLACFGEGAIPAARGDSAAVEHDVVPPNEDASGETVAKETKSVGVVIDAAFDKEPSPISPHSPNSENEDGQKVADEAVNKNNEDNENVGKAGMVVASSAANEQNPAKEGQAGEATEGKQAVAGVAVSEGGEGGEEPTFGDTESPPVKDSLPSFNRTMFNVNDKIYYYGLKPAYKGYNYIIPEKARISVRNFFTNLKMPVRFFNCLFQAKFANAGIEMSRFMINSTVGLAGFFDPAKSKFNMEMHDADFGQTLAKCKVGSGTYINWPVIGPSTVRDTVGYVGDLALSPTTWVSFFFLTPIESVGRGAYETVNDVSIDKGTTYENITVGAIDPYVALQDAYVQYRNKKIKE
ncbi:MAG: VacJ family lipoprotein [Planctomycetes bacterium]|nr:VacJ family lipoprotein [Planctomycetota bacterium]